MKLNDWLDGHCDPSDLCAPEMEIGDATSILAEELIDKDWYITYPANGKQCLAEVVCWLVKYYKRPWWKRIFKIF